MKSGSTKQTFDEMKETYGDDASSYDVVKHWHDQFKCGLTSTLFPGSSLFLPRSREDLGNEVGRSSVEKAPIPGRPHSAIDEDTIHQVEAAILEDRRITVRLLKDSFGHVSRKPGRFF